MVATYIDGGKTAVNALLFGQNNNSGILQSMIGNSNLVNTSDFFNNSIQVLNNAYYSDETLAVGRQVVNMYGSMFDPNVLYMINDDNITSANYMMKHIIASNPEVYRLNNLGFIDGYSETVGDIGLVDFVTSGDVTIKDDSISYHTHSDLYYDELFDDEDVILIKNAWEVAERLIHKGIDPTSPTKESF